MAGTGRQAGRGYKWGSKIRADIDDALENETLVGRYTSSTEIRCSASP
jgi:hypothetical protein